VTAEPGRWDRICTVGFPATLDVALFPPNCNRGRRPNGRFTPVLAFSGTIWEDRNPPKREASGSDPSRLSIIVRITSRRCQDCMVKLSGLYCLPEDKYIDEKRKLNYACLMKIMPFRMTPATGSRRALIARGRRRAKFLCGKSRVTH
jgi:hypothetical protein